MKHCLDCGFVGRPEHFKPGSGSTEVVLWLLFLVPGVFYTLWRRSARYHGCARCTSKHIVPIESPVAQAALGRLSPTPSAQSWFCMSCGQPIFGGGRYCPSCTASTSQAH
jgi:hypothetical protein